MNNFNQLTNGEGKRLAILLEELGEVQHVIGKILRHGYESTNPDIDSSETNRKLLERELGDLTQAITMLCITELNKEEILKFAGLRAKNIEKYLHHNDE